MWTIHSEFLAPAQGHFEEHNGKKTFVFDTPPQMTTRDMRLRLTEEKATELVKAWNKENGMVTGMKPTYYAVVIKD